MDKKVVVIVAVLMIVGFMALLFRKLFPGYVSLECTTPGVDDAACQSFWGTVYKYRAFLDWFTYIMAFLWLLIVGIVLGVHRIDDPHVWLHNDRSKNIHRARFRKEPYIESMHQKRHTEEYVRNNSS